MLLYVKLGWMPPCYKVPVAGIEDSAMLRVMLVHIPHK